MAYRRNIPQANDALNVSQPQLFNNTNDSDTSFGQDHYPFSDETANNGFHNQATTPIIDPAGHPTTTADYCRFYAMQDKPTLPILQYSRGPSDAVPSPLTKVMGGTGGDTIPGTVPGPAFLNIFDLTDVKDLVMEGFAYKVAGVGVAADRATAIIYYTSGGGLINGAAAGDFVFAFNGSNVSLKNNTVAGILVYWVLDIKRIQVTP